MQSPKPKHATQDDRIRLYRLLAMGNTFLQKNRPSFTEDDYREILMQCGASEHGNRISAKTMSNDELQKALDRLKKLGWTPRKPKAVINNKNNAALKNHWRQKRIGKLFALWSQMATQGRVKNGSYEAMEKWCKGSTHGLNSLEWATSAQLNQCIEMLKKFSSR